MNLFIGFFVGIAFTINFQFLFGLKSELESEVVQAIKQCEATLTRDKHCEYKTTAEIIKETK